VLSDTNPPLYLSPVEAAARLNCSHWTIRKMITDGRLRAVRVGRLIRINERDLERALRPVGRQMRGGGDV